MAKLFFGGILPEEGKELSCHRPIELPPAPPRVWIPLSQHIGAPCRPLVKKGDQVCLGQLIGDGDGLCAPVHASVSGVVAAVEPHVVASGVTAPCVVIDNDFLDTPDPSIQPPADPDGLSVAELIECIRRAGIVGLGGAAFPTATKITSALGRCQTLIINAAECEPYITADDRLLREQSGRVLRGIELLRRIFDLPEAQLCVESNKKEALRLLRAAAPAGVRLRVLRTRYPQGSEKQLIQAVTGQQVPPGGLPADVGCAVFNAATCAAIADAVDRGLPLVQRVVTVTGEAIAKPANFLTPVGTPYQHLIDAAGGFSQTPGKVISGGPMMGIAQYDLSVPTAKGCNAILALPEEPPAPSAVHCIRCGRCVRACPMRLMPLYLYQYERRDNTQGLEEYHVRDCIECGCCAYVCPGRLPLVQSLRAGKTKVQQAAAEAQRLAALRQPVQTGGDRDG